MSHTHTHTHTHIVIHTLTSADTPHPPSTQGANTRGRHCPRHGYHRICKSVCFNTSRDSARRHIVPLAHASDSHECWISATVVTKHSILHRIGCTMDGQAHLGPTKLVQPTADVCVPAKVGSDPTWSSSGLGACICHRQPTGRSDGRRAAAATEDFGCVQALGRWSPHRNGSWACQMRAVAMHPQPIVAYGARLRWIRCDRCCGRRGHDGRR